MWKTRRSQRLFMSHTPSTMLIRLSFCIDRLTTVTCRSLDSPCKWSSVSGIRPIISSISNLWRDWWGLWTLRRVITRRTLETAWVSHLVTNQRNRETPCMLASLGTVLPHRLRKRTWTSAQSLPMSIIRPCNGFWRIETRPSSIGMRGASTGSRS